MTVFIDQKDAFAHVVYEYRCLVRAEFAFRKSAKAPKTTNKILPEIGTIARNAVLAKARALIDFYIRPGSVQWLRDTDIVLKEYFNTSLQTHDTALYTRLKNIRTSMEVHDLHITAWRDTVHRSHNSDRRGRVVDRIDWDEEQAGIVDDLVKALEVVAPTMGIKWEKAFLELHDCCKRILESGGDWDGKLNSPAHITNYLVNLGL